MSRKQKLSTFSKEQDGLGWSPFDSHICSPAHVIINNAGVKERHGCWHRLSPCGPECLGPGVF